MITLNATFWNSSHLDLLTVKKVMKADMNMLKQFFIPPGVPNNCTKDRNSLSLLTLYFQ